MNNKELLANHVKENGKEFLAAYTIGVIEGIVELRHIDSKGKVYAIAETLKAFKEIDRDNSLPWKIKIAPAPTEAEKNIHQPKYTPDNSKIEPFFDRRMAEEVLQKETLCNTCRFKFEKCEANYEDLQFRNGWGYDIITGCKLFKPKEDG